MNRILRQFNWRFLLVRFLVNAIAVAITAAVTPKIYFIDKSIWSWLLITVMLGVLNALLKPLLQFLTLQFIFVTYGLVIVLVNSLILWLLSFLFPARFAVDNLLWALVGGLVLGLLSSFLESLLGLTMPIVADEPLELRHQLEEQARQVDWLSGRGREAAPEMHALAIEPVVGDAKAPGPGVAEPAVPESGVAEATLADAVVAAPPAAEPSTPEPDEGPSPAVEVEEAPFDTAVAAPAEAGVPAEAAAPPEGGISVGPEAAPVPGEEQKEDRS